MSLRPVSRIAFVVAALLPWATFLPAQDPAPAPAAGADADAKKMGPFTIVKEFDRLPVISQDSTGTCWSFGTTSFLESEVKRLQGKDVDLSEMWWARVAVVEKARRYMEAGGKANFSEGGLAHDLTILMKDYGAMPQSVYTGLVEGKKKHAHGEMFAVMTAALKGMTGQDKPGAESKPAKPKKPSPQFIDAMFGIADAYLGHAPKTFEVDGKTYDPKTFVSDYLKIEPQDYVEVMSYSTAPFGGKAALEVPDNWLKFDQYENVSIDQFMELFNSALEGGYSLALDADVSEKGFSGKTAVAVMSDAEEKDPKLITQEKRDAMFKKGETTDDHLMHVVGIAKHEDGRRFYLTKNSWGKTGPYGGYFFLSEAYIRAKALSVMVHKNAMKHGT